MKKIHHTPKRPIGSNQSLSGSGREGSALLLTILVVSLLLVIVLSFVLFVRMELREVTNRQNLTQARFNAKLGAEMAISRLQELAGRDTRVTARADILQGDEGNLYRPGLNRHPQRAYWTGVWDSASYDESDASAKTFLGWLVSGTAEDLNQAAQAPVADEIRLVGPGSVSSLDQEVRVPSEPVGSGQYAWWVSDEGSKIRFNLQDPYRETSDFTTRQFSMKAAQRHAAELLTYDDVTPLSQAGLYPLDDPDFTSLRKRMVSTKQLSLVGGSSGSSAADAYRQLRLNRFHDITLESRGVLADVRNGGLKKDLSLAFEMPLTDFNNSEFGAAHPDSALPAYRPTGYPSGLETAPVYLIDDFSDYGFQPENGPDGSASADGIVQNPNFTLAPEVRGPSWLLLRNFSRMSKQDDPDRGFFGLNTTSYIMSGGRRIYQGRGNWPDASGLAPGRLFGQDVGAWTYVENYGPLGVNYTRSFPLGKTLFPGLAPIPIRSQTVLSLRRGREVTGTNPGDPVQYEMDLFLDPIVTLWNPYNVPIATGEANGQPLQLSIMYQNVNMIMEVSGGSSGTEQIEQELAELLSDNSSGITYVARDNEAYLLNLDVPNSFVMEPGEVVIFSSAANEVTYERTSFPNEPARSGVELDLAPGITGFLPVESGFRLPNVFGRSFEEVEAIRMQMKTDTQGPKFQVVGRNYIDNAPPFFSSFESAATSVDSGWSTAPMPLSNFGGSKVPFGLFDAHMKNESSDNPVNMLSQFNPRATTFEQGSTFEINSNAFVDGVDQQDFWYGHWSNLSSWNGTWLDTHGNGSRGSFWGGSNTASGGSAQIIVAEAPRLPPLSLATLQHVPVTQAVDEPANVIGNSFRPWFVHSDEKISQQSLNPNNGIVAHNVGRAPNNRQDWTLTRIDHSYLLNEALWDSYYFSSILPDSETGLSTAQRFTAFQDGSPLPNSTFVYAPGYAGNPDDVRQELFAGGTGDILPEAPRLAAEFLLQEGTFNINSVSVEAWRALISSTRQLAINVQNQNAPLNLTGTGFSRTALPFDFEDDKWNGYRNLTDAQIDTLASAIVDEIRVRGPFLNLGDFINRRLTPDGHASQRSGPLQAAIDQSSLNSAFTRTLADGGVTSTDLRPYVRDNVDLSSPVAMGAPGYFTQADLLTLIGPMLSARSDTFMIRAYGTYADVEAWCELTVQRVPEYVDSSRPRNEPAQWRPSDPPDNRSRRFVITNFRWLHPDDI